MKNTLSFALSTVLGLGIAAGAAMAQDAPNMPPDGPRPGGRMQMDPNQQVQRLAKQLNLSPDQVSQIRPILEDSMKQSQAMRADQSMSREDKMAKMQSMRQDTESRVKAVLHDDQKAKYDQIVQQNHDRMRERMQQRQQGQPTPDAAPAPQQ